MTEDNYLGVDCPGCKAQLTTENAGGYRTYCTQCVAVIPPLPATGHGYLIEGTYPDFKWVRGWE